MNWEIVSTSLVTRLTSAPRRSVFWVSTDRSCTRRNAVVRSCARPASVAVNSRRFTTYEQNPVSRTTTAAPPTSRVTACTSGPPPALMPVSTVCCTVTGTMTRPTVATTASARVNPRPCRICGDSSSPRFSVASTVVWARGLDRRAGALGLGGHRDAASS